MTEVSKPDLYVAEERGHTLALHGTNSAVLRDTGDEQDHG